MPNQLSLGLASGLDDVTLGPSAVVLRRFASASEGDVLRAIARITASAPFRHMTTPGGFTMSAAMTNCGAFGWVSSETGYRYEGRDPTSAKPWPAMPSVFLELARTAAERAGFAGFEPDACLVNRYAPGARLTLHQDRDERDMTAPIVSVSLGLPATFLFGGDSRTAKCARIPLEHGDVVVWGGASRLRYHGVMPIEDGEHPLVGPYRINLTFRKAM